MVPFLAQLVRVDFLVTRLLAFVHKLWSKLELSPKMCLTRPKILKIFFFQVFDLDRPQLRFLSAKIPKNFARSLRSLAEGFNFQLRGRARRGHPRRLPNHFHPKKMAFFRARPCVKNQTIAGFNRLPRERRKFFSILSRNHHIKSNFFCSLACARSHFNINQFGGGWGGTLWAINTIFFARSLALARKLFNFNQLGVSTPWAKHRCRVLTH